MVNVRDVKSGAPSVGSLELSPIVTSSVGAELSLTVNVADSPASVVVMPEIGLITIPGPLWVIFSAGT